MAKLTYALITPAKNEAAYLEHTIESVAAQTCRPSVWVIVDDNSSDATSEVVKRFAAKYDFIRLISHRQESSRRTFASKAHAFNAGLQVVDHTAYDFIGNLDADITVPPQYYANMLAAFEHDPQLGLAGGLIYVHCDSHYETDDTTDDSVGGAVQLFRQACLKDIGGYIPLECGGIDAAAEVMARMHGWRVSKIPGNVVFERRLTGSTQYGVLRARYEAGVQFRRLGYDFGFFMLRCLYRLNESPVGLSSLLSLAGYLYAMSSRASICPPANAVRFLRAEQRAKLRALFAFKGVQRFGLCPRYRISRHQSEALRTD